MVNVCQENKTPCCLCGEIAGDVEWTSSLLETGLREISVSPHMIPSIKEAIRKVSTV